MEASKKRKQPSAKSGKKLCKKDNIVLGEDVLLNYTYYLDDLHNNKVSLGFDPISFDAKIVFHRNGRFPVSTCYTGWEAVHKHLINMDLTAKELKTKYEIPVGRGSILLNLMELYKFFDMLEFFNIVMFHNNNAAAYVKEYFNSYVEKCKEKKLLKLASEHFFIPSRTSYININYSRLFYEIPHYCCTGSGYVIFNKN